MVEEKLPAEPPHFIIVYEPSTKAFTHKVVGDIPFAELAMYLDIFILNQKLATLQQNAMRQMAKQAGRVEVAQQVPKKTLFPGRFP